MEPNGQQLIFLLAGLEILQLFLFWAYIRQRYHLSLRQLLRIAEQLADGRRPRSYFVDGPRQIGEVAENLEKAGLRLETLQRVQQEEDFNLNVLLAHMIEGVVVVDQRHVVRLVNDELLKLFDLKHSPLGRTLLEALREARVEMIVRETIQSGELQEREVTLESTSLAMRHFFVSSVPIRTKAREVRGAVVVMRDITRLKQLEAVRQEFVANVSHELRTPLAIFRGYLETLADNPGLPPEDTQRMIDAMRRHSNRLNALVEDLLTLTRLDAKQIEAEYQAVRIGAMLRQLANDWKKRPDAADVTFTVEAEDSLPPVEMDPLRFEQVLLNLVENAVTYASPPRRVLLKAAVVDGQMEIRVGDNGIGIPPTDLPHVFERFYRVDKARARASGGTGLGLSIVKHIVQSHKGDVHAESEIGKGTTIVIRLPLTQEPEGPTSLPNA